MLEGQKIAQHYLLSAEARNLSIIKIAMINDLEAFEMFENVRWSSIL